MITCRASLDVSRERALFLARLLAAHQRVLGTRRRRRALSPWGQAVLVLRWFRGQGVRPADLARDHGIALATVYRYLHEGIDVLAQGAPDLHTELVAAKAAGAEVRAAGRHLDRDRPHHRRRRPHHR